MPLEKVCDGIKQCRYGDDELLCDVTCPSNCQCNGVTFTCSASEGNQLNITTAIPHKARKLNLARTFLNITSHTFDLFNVLINFLNLFVSFSRHLGSTSVKVLMFVDRTYI